MKSPVRGDTKMPPALPGDYLHLHLIFICKIYFTKKTISILLISTAVFCFSCNAINTNKTEGATADSLTVAMPAYDVSLPNGRVIDTVVCKNDNTQTYALYLPSGYHSDAGYPCIYFFDAHARGALPLNIYKTLAEKYGFVFIASNVSKNGVEWQQTNEGINLLMSDTRSRINIDPKRIYTAGFSGGARVASSVALQDGGVTGVIGCAAGFGNSNGALQNKFNYFGIVGEYDFNIHEMEQLDTELDQNGFNHQLLRFEGIHGWAPLHDFETAILWMLVNEMKANILPKNEAVIKALKASYDSRIAAARSATDRLNAYGLLTGAMKVLDGLVDVSDYGTQLSELGKPDAKTQEQLQQSESQLQQNLVKQFTLQDAKWWKDKIASLSSKGASLEEKRMNHRLLSYLGFIAYMYTSRAINTGDFAHAETFLEIFKIADPKNPDCGYLKAILYAQNGNSQLAIASLNEAASEGYNDIGTLSTENAFAILKDAPEYRNVVNKVKDNLKK